MRPKVDRVTVSSNALQYVGEYVGDIILNLLIVASTFALDVRHPTFQLITSRHSSANQRPQRLSLSARCIRSVPRTS